MIRAHRLVIAAALGALILSTAANAQQSSQEQPATPSRDTRPATTTFLGDTGLWFVPTGEILPARTFSVSGYRANFDRQEGFSDISHFAPTIAVGLGDRVELFGSFRVVTRIDRDVRPLFITGNEAGGPVNEYPLVRLGWTGDAKVGDVVVGAKFNITSQHRQQPFAFAVRGFAQVPTGDEDAGVTTGKIAGGLDLIVSKELNEAVELSGFVGPRFRSSPSAVEISNGVAWGAGAGFPTRSPLRAFLELTGESYFDSEIVRNSVIVAEDGSILPARSSLADPVDLALGAVWQHGGGFFAGAGVSVALNHEARENLGSGPGFGEGFRDRLGFQARLGYHPGVRIYVPPPPPRQAPPPPPPNRPPVVKARCEPCTVETGQNSTVTADASDPDGDTLTYRWTAPSGSFGNASDRQTPWTAPNEPGAVPVTVTVDDGRGGTATDTVTIQVVRPTVREFVFEDVHFDFDRYTLRPEAVRLLDEVVSTMQENGGLQITIEGHTCNIGTAEYNLALGERRANAVRDYLVSRNVTAGRLNTISYGEERPKHDNAREETRRLNRRAALVVRVQQQ